MHMSRSIHPDAHSQIPPMTAPGPVDFLPAAIGVLWQLGSYLAAAHVTVSAPKYILTQSKTPVSFIQIYVYDRLLSIPDECAMVANSGITWSISIYFLSRYPALSPVRPGDCADNQLQCLWIRFFGPRSGFQL